LKRSSHALRSEVFASLRVSPRRVMTARAHPFAPASTVLRTCPTPDRAATCRGVRGGEPRPIGPPPITRIALPACCSHYPGGPERVRLPVPSPFHTAFPVTQSGRRPHRYFRGLLRLYTLRPTGLLSRPPATFVTGLQPARSPAQTACQLLDQPVDYRDGIFLHWQHAPSGRTGQNRPRKSRKLNDRSSRFCPLYWAKPVSISIGFQRAVSATMKSRNSSTVNVSATRPSSRRRF
jgi:hypothetical protein